MSDPKPHRPGESRSEDAEPRPVKKRKKPGKAPRPDQMTRETFRFVAAVDHYKREHMKSFLADEEVLEVVRRMGYARPERKRDAVGEYRRALERYKSEHGRLFPNWSEVFDVVLALGYAPGAQDSVA